MKQHGPLVSACLIVRDEQDDLAGCLDSISGLVDEIVVVDTGSTDDSIRIAKDFGARVFCFDWCDDFSAARNASIERARGAWILVVDADERLEVTSRPRFRRRLRDSSDPAMTVCIRSQVGDDEFEDAHITRLFRNEPHIRYHGRIHEHVLGSVAERLGVDTWTPPASGLRLQHHGYTAELRKARGKAQRNRALLTQEIEESPNDPGPRYLLAREMIQRAGGDVLDTADTREAVEIIWPAAETLASVPPRGITDACLSAAVRAAAACGSLDRARGLARSWRERLGPTARWYYATGEIELAEGRFDRAARAFGRVGKAPEGSTALPTPASLKGAWSTVRAHLASGRGADDRADATTEWSMLSAVRSMEKDEVTAALQGLTGALGRDGQDPRLWAGLAICFERAGIADRADQALGCARKAAHGWQAVDSLERLRSTRSGLVGVLARVAVSLPAR